MNEEEIDPSWGLEEIRQDWAYVTNWNVDPKAMRLREKRLELFDRALAVHDEWIRLSR